ncbi:MAG: ribonuclease E activity regulator RraA [Pseudomonadales bacterium]
MYVLPDLCDEYPDLIRVVTPFFSNSGLRNFGGCASFGGEITTIKCHEDNSLVASRVEQPGAGKVLIVDGGGSMRCGLLGDNLALKASDNGWEGIIVYGCIRDVDIIATIDLGVQALASNPMKSVKRDIGLLDEVVTFGGVDFIPGQFVYADNNGIIVAQRALPKK